MQVGDLVKYIRRPSASNGTKAPPQQYQYEGAIVIGIIVGMDSLGRWWHIQWSDGSIDNRVGNELEVLND